ncbi:MAG TPA: peptidyl-prolyl cis-trans isomerase [Sphingomicrobium sp.]|nr:peptidyl-prolyl cis-trans isomerase [Sphingomicrobium sp.]
MLQAIRSKAGSLPVKLLFALLIVVFGIWGIGDVFLGRNRGETTVATVGDTDIHGQELQTAVRAQMERLGPLFGGSLDIAQAKQIGLIDSTLDQIISRNLLDLEAKRLGLAVGDEVIRDAIQSNPAFHNSKGVFDRAVYDRVLAANRLNDPQYEQQLRSEIGRENLAKAIAAGAVTPPVMADALYRARNEKRTALTVLLPLTSVPAPGAPDEKELGAFYEAHREQFRAPEYRGFTALVMRPEDIAPRIDVPDTKLHQAYENRIAEFQRPERRQIEQILLPNEEKAKEAATELAAGKDFYAVAKELANETPEQAKLGWVKRSEMPEALANAAFSLSQGAASQPVKGPFGWAILRVTGIEAGATKPFAEVKDKLKMEVAKEKAADQLYELSNQIDDALAGGATLEEAAKKIGLKPLKIPTTDPSGRDPTGQAISIPEQTEILNTVFDTPSGQTSQVIQAKDDSFYVVRVDKITPSEIRPLNKVHDKAVELWQADKRKTELKSKAEQLAAEVRSGKPLAAAAADGLKVETVGPFGRKGEGADKLPPVLVAKLFEAKPKGVVTAGTPDGYMVGQLDKIEQPSPSSDTDALHQLSQQLQAGIQADLLASYETSLRQRFPVEINHEEMQRLF